MKKEIKTEELYNSVFLLQPSRPILCTTKNDDGSDNVAPFSWINPVSHNPPRVALALLNKPHKQNSLINIERTGEFVVNIPDIEIAEKLVECSYKTKFGENKFERSNFKRLKSMKVNPPGIEECKAHLECKAINLLDAGDHTLIIADILYARYNEEAFSDSMLVNLLQFRPIIHLQHYCTKNSQVHIFLSSRDSHAVEVPYPSDMNCI